MVKCPYCLERTSPKFQVKGSKKNYVCAKCNTELPRDFVEKTKIPRTTVGLVGYTGHGKTVFITSLFYLLEELVAKWKNYYLLTLDDNTHPILYQRVPIFKNSSQLPSGTPLNFPHPALIHFRKIPCFGDRFISFYDVGGGVYTNTQTITGQGMFVAHSDLVLFILSISDSGSDWTEYIKELLDRYIRAVYDYMHVDIKNTQHLVVVFTKADMLKNSEPGKQLSPNLINYLDNGSYNKAYANFNCGYLKEMKTYSQQIRNWLISQKGGGFINAAEDNFKSVEYTIISATGAAPVGQNLAQKLQPDHPKRVLDPFIWVLVKTQKVSLKRILRKILGGI